MFHGQNRKVIVGVALAASLLLYMGFLYFTHLAMSPFILFGAMIFLLFPLRRESPLIRRVMFLAIVSFVIWMLSEVAFLLVPFIISFVLAYILDPTVTFFQRRNVPRVVIALLIVLLGVGIVALISVFVFPIIYTQLDSVIRKVSSLVLDYNEYLESRRFFRQLSKLGLPSSTLRNIMATEIAPRLKGIFETVFRALLVFLTNVSGIATQVINIILIPILLFYFLKDFDKLKRFIRVVLEGKNDKLLHDLHRINIIVQAYVGGQIIAAFFVGISASLLFTMVGIPYPILLGLVCGLLNPIPYVGIFSSLVVGALVLILTDVDSFLLSLGLIALIVTGLHVIDTYLLQPRIVGRRIGLHPLMLIASLFIFGYFFGLIGLLFAVPTTAVLMMFFNDWLKNRTNSSGEEQPPAETDILPEIPLVE